ncbi:hypothetical protein BDY21DRAFT_339838 [Lineolata rhizophorae]|uniref:Uncharacterized protein n=1 Tax=Lineolata rhizophorae TaxID=578093 RepID=A0A6A6P541_9PEZI|nr:hypothetical protein BDY21DRAFT_339838 [Lineolata rhizophorae]
MSSSGPPQQQSGPPYLPTTWTIGGIPDKSEDIPATSVFLALYVLGAATHMAIFQINRRRGHKFIFSVLMFGFCMARIVTCSLRLANLEHPDNISLAIAAAIFVQAGVLLVFIINLLFAQRLVRAQHPHFGWSMGFRVVMIALYVLVVLTLAMVITATVQSFYTLSTNTRRIDRDIQLYAGSYFFFVAVLPIPMVLLSLAVPRRSGTDKFGHGRFRTKIFVLLTASTLLAFGAGWKLGSNAMDPVQRRGNPVPWYYTKAPFYIVNFTVEVLVIALYALLRIDLRFHIPDGARGPGAYSSGKRDTALSTDGEAGGAPKDVGDLRRPSRVYTEEDAYNFDYDDEARSPVESTMNKTLSHDEGKKEAV